MAEAVPLWANRELRWLVSKRSGLHWTRTALVPSVDDILCFSTDLVNRSLEIVIYLLSNDMCSCLIP
jgi:hypothetical protein